MQYKLHLSLQQTAALKIAILFWKRKEVKDKVAEFFESCEKFNIYEDQRKWHGLTNSLVDKWNKDVLPKHLEDELIHMVRMTAERILHWYQYIKHEYKAKQEAINCLNKIKWTPYGTVDVVKTFKSSWLDNPNLDITKVYTFACRYAITDHINELWDKIPVDIQNCFYDDKIYWHFNQNMKVYWKSCKGSDLHSLMEYFQLVVNDLNRRHMNIFNLIYDLNRSTEENIVRLSIHQGYSNATKYFWGKLTEEEKNECVLKCARIAVIRYHYYEYNDESIRGFKKSQYVEICIFLMNQMSDNHKRAFFNEKLWLDFYHFDCLDIKDELLKMILSVWPWQELFIPLLKDMLQCRDDNSPMDCLFLYAITKKMVEGHELGYFLETRKLRCLFREAWLIIPASIKQNIVHCSKISNTVNDLVNLWDLGNLKLIFNDPEIETVRDQFINFGLRTYEQLVVNDEYEKLEYFIKQILKSDEEIKQFKQMINPWCQLIIKDPFYFADKLLDWQSSTPEERQSLKNKIDHMTLSKDLIEMSHYRLVNKLISWKFDSEEMKKHPYLLQSYAASWIKLR